jgi:hypothetical protein
MFQLAVGTTAEILRTNQMWNSFYTEATATVHNGQKLNVQDRIAAPSHQKLFHNFREA